VSTARSTVKITDVAALAGVAPMTVSRVLNNPGQVATATALRVRAAIEQLGYVPNLIAGGLSSRRSRIVAAIVPTIATPVFATSIQAFTDALGHAGYHVVLGLSGYAPGGEDALVAAVLGRQPDGIMLAGAQHSPAVRLRLATSGIPVVEIWDMVDDPADMIVGFDHASVGAAAAGYLRAKGHRRFATIGADDPRAAARRHGLADAVRAGGGAVLFDTIMPAPASIQGGRDAVAAAMRHLHQPVAVFCSSDLVAAGAVIEAQARGLAVPGQLAVCGFGDFEISAAMNPPITTVAVDGAEIGRAAADCLLKRLGGVAGPRRVIVRFRIVERGSA